MEPLIFYNPDPETQDPITIPAMTFLYCFNCPECATVVSVEQMNHHVHKTCSMTQEMTMSQKVAIYSKFLARKVKNEMVDLYRTAKRKSYDPKDRCNICPTKKEHKAMACLKNLGIIKFTDEIHKLSAKYLQYTLDVCELTYEAENEKIHRRLDEIREQIPDLSEQRLAAIFVGAESVNYNTPDGILVLEVINASLLKFQAAQQLLKDADRAERQIHMETNEIIRKYANWNARLLTQRKAVEKWKEFDQYPGPSNSRGKGNGSASLF
uniref:Uncharacterized protein n=3 Tax=Caenorhabditis japonica TaxID=281687 RepID=A0A8R1DU33_CAEJA